jgi:hypothetical protein
MIRARNHLALFLVLFFCVCPSLAAELGVLARPGPWPVADRLIAYQGRIWFSTAVKGVDHNSADIWSFDPTSQESQFERYLFSQNTGHPVVHKGLLYWPHEDMRIGLGAGVVSVTNGVDWRDLLVPADDPMMHTHATAEWRGQLVAAMAGWNSVLAASDDAGKSWRLLVNDPPKSGSFHRYNDVAALGDRLFVRHWQDTGLSLGEFRDGHVAAVEAWPNNRYFSPLTRFAGALYALVDADDGKAELWRIDLHGAEKVDVGTAGLDMRQLISDGKSLWFIARTGNGGQLWSSADGQVFLPGDTFRGGLAHSAAAAAPGKIFVGGQGADGKAILWGPPPTTGVDVPGLAVLPEQRVGTALAFDGDAEKRRLRAVLIAPDNYQRHGRPLRKALREVLLLNPPPDFFASLLEAEVPEQDIEIFGGRFTVPARDMATWQILAAMAQNGDRSVPSELLTGPWQRQPNRPQKWFDALLIAMHAVQLSGQSDRETVDALMGRLDNAGDPDWLQSQVTGTLTAITGEHFAYDKAAWTKWWALARKNWPQKPS